MLCNDFTQSPPCHFVTSAAPMSKNMQTNAHFSMTPDHYLAYSLHLKYRDERLSPDQIEQAHALLITKNPDLLVQLCSCQAVTEPFIKTIFYCAWVA